MSRAYKHACGCRSTDERWIELCPACKAEFDERHTRWQAEHVERQAQKQPAQQARP